MNRVIACFALLLSTTAFAATLQYKVIYSFGNSSGDAGAPFAGLLIDKAGNLYGTTDYGGAGDDGAIYELSPSGTGGWTETVLYSFCASGNVECPDGARPEDALIMDAAGNLYGTTTNGGSGGLGVGAYGVVFELSPPSQQGGAWTESVLYNFCSDYSNGICLDGDEPMDSVVLDAAGNLYGTTFGGGTANSGVAFELSPSASGWTETVIHSFCSNFRGGLCLDGLLPVGGLTFDKAGNLYGTTFEGGTSPQTLGSGIIFKLSPGTNGWIETVLYDFGLPNATSPLTSVTMDRAGNLYGPLSESGAHGKGGLFQWVHSTGQLREIDFKGSDGSGPDGSVLIDPLGRGFFGTATYGGKNIGHGPAGTVYRVSPAGKKTTIYEFCSQPNCTDGMNPFGNLVEDSQGNIYGTAAGGGANRAGVVYEITP